MTIRIGSKAPNFTAQSTEGEIEFHSWAGTNWIMFFSHPRDFTPVCTTELGEVAKLKSAFDERNVKAIGLSVDTVEDHNKWSKDIEETQNVSLNFPLLADPNREVSELYDMIHPEADDTFTVRSVFFIDPNKTIRAILTYPAPTGRNFKEIIRVIDSLQLTDKTKVATPVNWNPGDDAIILPTISNEEAKNLFPQGWDEQKPYLRKVALDSKSNK